MLLPCLLSARFPPGQATGPVVQAAEEKAVLATIEALFAAFESGDSAAMLRLVYPDGRVTASGRRGDGTSNLRPQSWATFAERITPQRAFQERITTPTVHVDDASRWFGLRSSSASAARSATAEWIISISCVKVAYGRS